MDENPEPVFDDMTVKEFKEYMDHVYSELLRLSNERRRIEDYGNELMKEFN